GVGATVSNHNFGEVAAASLAGRVYSDLNNNGLFDGVDVGIGGVDVRLAGTNDLGAIAPITVTTGAGGTYTFSHRPPGTYTVTEPTQPAGFLDGLEARGGVVIPGTKTTDFIDNIVLAAGATSANNTFGEVAAATLKGFVFSDLNNNGLFDGVDVGIG